MLIHITTLLLPNERRWLQFQTKHSTSTLWDATEGNQQKAEDVENAVNVSAVHTKTEVLFIQFKTQ